MNTTKIRLPVVVSLIAVAALIAAPTTLSTYAQPSRAGQVSGFGEGVMTCPNGFSANSDISFSATQSQTGDVSGTWSIFGPFFKQGVITDGHIGLTNYRLTGAESFPACLGTQISDILITGKCGNNVKISFRAEDREIGNFFGTVFCR
jgi:hypothetical protein